jgi:hypothetical protein
MSPSRFHSIRIERLTHMNKALYICFTSLAIACAGVDESSEDSAEAFAAEASSDLTGLSLRNDVALANIGRTKARLASIVRGLGGQANSEINEAALRAAARTWLLSPSLRSALFSAWYAAPLIAGSACERTCSVTKPMILAALNHAYDRLARDFDRDTNAIISVAEARKINSRLPLRLAIAASEQAQTDSSDYDR